MHKCLYSTEPDGDGMFKVLKRTIETKTSYWSSADEKQTVILDGVSKWNADYIASCFDYLKRSKALELSTIDELSAAMKPITLERLAYFYVKDTLGNGWGIHNGYKLMTDFFLDMWLAGCSCRFGFLGADASADVVRETLKDSIKRVLDYCHA